MRFMMFMMPGEPAETGEFPELEAFRAMGRYNQKLRDAGILLDLTGLQPSAKGARLDFTDGKVIVTDGPFTESKEIVGGYWMIEVGSKEEAIAWAKQCPCVGGDFSIVIRQLQEFSDFPEEIREALTAGA